MAEPQLKTFRGSSKEIHCFRCGYNLRGLQSSTSCPECGLEISTTLAGPSLRHANPFWLQRIILGVTGIAAAKLLFCSVNATRLLAQIASSPSRPYENWWSHVALIAWSVQWGSALLLLSGAEPGIAKEHEPTVSLRRLLLYFGWFLITTHILPI